MQFQADVLQTHVIRPKILETTALGAAYLAGLGVGFWTSVSEVTQLWKKDAEFNQKAASDEMSKLLLNWQKALDRSAGWISE